MSAECIVPDCQKPARTGRRSGLCAMHQTRLDRHGSLDDPRPTLAQRLRERIAVAPTGCWQWTGALRSDGYGQIRCGGQTLPAHRAAYLTFGGPIPDGLHLDHLCRNRGCVNPAHLEPVTAGENIRRGEPANRAHCPRMHPYTPENTRVRNGSRHCLTCHRIHQANYLARKAAS